MRIRTKRNGLALIATIAIMAGTIACRAQGPEQQPDMTLNEAARKEVIEGIIGQLNKSYVFPDVAKKMEDALRKRVQNHEYDSVTSASTFAQMLTTHLQDVSHDKHLRVRYSHDTIPAHNEEQPTPEDRERERQYGNVVNFGFEKVERLPGNIGYLEMRGFFDATLGGETAAAAMNFIANTDALIIDLRRNGGGDPAMVMLVCSYLFGPEPVHLNDIYWHPDDSTHQWWTLPYLPGKRYEGKDVYVLTSKRTFSAAEEFTYNLKNLKRATIVGETTGGGANPGGSERLNDHFAVFVPMGRAINPITKTNWEGTGVTPDIDVPADYALKTAQLTALNKLLPKTKDENLKSQLHEIISTVQKELDALKQQDRHASK